MQVMRPKISIIVPVYNVQNYLVQCLESVLHQTLEEIEVICVDDGSRDNSSKILQEYKEKDKRITVITQENQGLSGARNAALKYVTSEYVMYLDSDDWIDLETCEVAYKEIINENADIVMWSYVREFKERSLEKHIFAEERIIFEGKEVKEKLHRRFIGLLGEELSWPENAEAIVTAWGKLYKTSLIKENNIMFVDTKKIGTEDALFNLFVYGYAGKVVFLNRYFNHYRKDNMSSLTFHYKAQLFQQWNTLFDIMQSYIEENNLSQEYRIALENRIALSILGLGLNLIGSSLSYGEKHKEIKKIISSERYREAYKNLEIKYFPMHWKVFYGCAKYNNALGVYILLLCIRKVIGN